jgi:hypothetical protein
MIAAALVMSAAAAEAPICADRPSKANGTCTVPAGHVQIETGLIDWTHNRSGGVRSDLILWGGTVLKYGVGQTADIELSVTPVETLHVRSADQESATGVGDTVVRWKQRLVPADAPVQVALIPFAKLPTASHRLGNGRVEGGLAVPLSTGLGKTGLTLTLGPELDLRADDEPHGYHLATTQLLNVGYALTSRLSIAAELWAQWDWQPAGTVRQASADASAAYLVTNDLQLDAGGNFGLNRITPASEFYLGVAKRF